MAAKLHFGGVPTDIDVRRLLDAFPDLKPGQQIAYAEVAELLGVDVRANRFRTVTMTWRRRVEKLRGQIIAARGDGFFEVLDDPGKVDQAGRHYSQIGTQIRRTFAVSALVDEQKLNDPQRARHQHHLRGAATVKQALMEQAKKKPATLPPPVTKKEPAD